MRHAVRRACAAAALAVVAVNVPLAQATWAAPAAANVQHVRFEGDVVHDVEDIPCLASRATVDQTMFGSVTIVTRASTTEVTGNVHGPLSFRTQADTQTPALTFTGWTEIHVGNHGTLNEAGEPGGRAQLQLTWLVKGTLSDGNSFAFEQMAQLRTDGTGAPTLELDHVVCRS